MKILFLDFMFYRGHARSYSKYIKSLAAFAKVIVYTQKGYYKDFNPSAPGVKLIEDAYLPVSRTRRLDRLSSLWIMYRASRLLRREKPDYIFVATFDTIAFYFGQIFLGGQLSKCYLVHHINTDEMTNQLKRAIFDRYKNKVHHFLFEKYMMNYLRDAIGVESHRIHQIIHPYNKNTGEPPDTEWDCVALSNSNSEHFVEQLLELERATEILKKKNVKIFVKSQKEFFDDGNLKIVNGYLPVADYNRAINSARYILVCFHERYQYRMSGTVVDALSNRKKVIGQESCFLNYYTDQYPQTCKQFRNLYEMIDLISEKEDPEEAEKEYSAFFSAHSDETMRENFEKVFNVYEEN